MKLISLNIEAHRHLERIIPFLVDQQPDVVCLQEVFRVDIPAFEAALNMNSVFVPMANVTQTSPHITDALGEWGLLMLTKHAVTNQGVDYYFGSADSLPIFFDNNDPNSMNRALLWQSIQIGTQEFTVGTTHFTWSVNGASTPLQLDHIAKLITHLQALPDVVVCGDFNAPRGGETFARLATHFKDNIPPEISTSIDGEFHKAGQLMLMVDGLFTTPHYQVTNFEMRPGLSDHQGLIAQIERIA